MDLEVKIACGLVVFGKFFILMRIFLSLCIETRQCTESI